MSRTHRFALLLGLLPLFAWAGMTALGWAPDAQVLSGTLDGSDPAGSAMRGLAYVGTWLTLAVVGPPLIGGSMLWWVANRVASRIPSTDEASAVAADRVRLSRAKRPA